MENEWKSKFAIIRDLAAVTRGAVHVDIGASITCDRPPAYVVNEEIEDEFLRQCYGDAPAPEGEGPDLVSIKMMLQVIDDKEAPTEDEHDPLTLSKLNPFSKEFVPTAPPDPPGPDPPGPDPPGTPAGHSTPITPDEAEQLAKALKEKIVSPPRTARARRERNVAVASLLKVRAGVAPAGLAPGRLLTPDDFMTKEVVRVDPKRVELVNRWLDDQRDGEVEKVVVQEEMPPKKELCPAKAKSVRKVEAVASPGVKVKPSIATVSAAGMFKKRAVAVAASPAVDSCQVSQEPPAVKPRSFVPSAQAEELYKKFKEMSDEKQALADDVWSAAERCMRARDAAAAAEAERQVRETVLMLEEYDLVGCEEHGTANFPPAILLARHRHDYPEPCDVCRAWCAAPPAPPGPPGPPAPPAAPPGPPAAPPPTGDGGAVPDVKLDNGAEGDVAKAVAKDDDTSNASSEDEEKGDVAEGDIIEVAKDGDTVNVDNKASGALVEGDIKGVVGKDVDTVVSLVD